MKKLIPAFLIALSTLGATTLNAQYCGGSGPSACTPNGAAPGQGFESMDSIPCIVKDSAYNEAAQFNMYTAFNFLGQQTVDSIEFVSITNLPCGMCWATSHANNRFKAGDVGCMVFKGTTNDSAGQYKLALTLTAWINGVPTGENIPPSLVSQTGIALYLRVRKPNDACAATDTSATANNLTASTGCPISAVEEVPVEINSVSLVPNPMNTTSQLSFTAEKAGNYILRITNIAGQEISAREIGAVTGRNNVIINRSNMPDGVYLVSLSNGKTSVTQKLVVLD